jgi:hypothetical protein
MSDDDELLARAFAAMRETTTGERADARTTRARILLIAQDRRRARARWAYTAIALAAAFVTTSAWAAVTGRLPRAVTALFSMRESPTPRAAGSGASPGPLPPQIASPPPDPAPTPTASAAPDPVPPERPTELTRAVASASAPRGPVDASDREDTIYAAAHRAHFVEKDPARALVAWDAYLAAYPRGRYVLEARYNRALDLVRLGRNDEARTALEPFARGEMNGYRQREARAILDALAQ